MITRKRPGKQFKYFDNGTELKNAKSIERINKLAIPPAWKDAKISKSPSAKIQASGFDAAGRKQSIYHPTFRLKQEKLKFERMLGFAQALPSLRRQLDKDLKQKNLSKEKVLTCIVKLIDMDFFRVGNEQYAKEHQTFGITTLRSKHTKITTNTITFDFIGKSGKHHVKKIEDPQVARIIKRLDELPGHEIFEYLDSDENVHNITSSDVNAYIKEHMGDHFTAKDFRTWGGTLLATSAILSHEIDEEASMTQRKKAVNEVVKSVAKRLGNTPAVTRSSYIDPQVFVKWDKDISLKKLNRAMKNMRPKKYMTVEEQCVLKLLS